MAIWGDFQGLTGVTRGGRGSKNWKIGMTSFMDTLNAIARVRFSESISYNKALFTDV